MSNSDTSNNSNHRGSFRGFQIYEKIGSGGMSTVYRGEHQILKYPVAVKILHPGLAFDEDFIARFEREAKAAATLRNSNIVSVIDFGSDNGVYFIIMELVDGEDLSQLFCKLQDKAKNPVPLPIEISLLLLEEVAFGLKAAHGKDVIHRDIKPGNILMDQQGEVKIADFGLVRDIRRQVQDLTLPGTVVGTPSYMSPEQAAGLQDIDGRSDIFSLGVMAYQFLTGVKPFVGETPTEVQEQVINSDPPPLVLENCPLLTPEIKRMINGMLAKDPDKRFQTIDGVLDAISESLTSLGSGHLPVNTRRQYLSRFAQQPFEYTEKMLQRNISSHLKRGYHLKTMGQEKTDDAIQEFQLVLSLSPKHEKAQIAVRELVKDREDSVGAGFPAKNKTMDTTQKMPSAVVKPMVPEKQVETPNKENRRFVLWALSLFLVLAVTMVGMKMWRADDADSKAVVVDSSLVAADTAGLDLSDGVNDTLQIALEAIPTEGRLSVITQPDGARITIRSAENDFNQEPWVGKTPIQNIPILAGEYSLRFQLTGYETETLSLMINEGESISRTLSLQAVKPVPKPQPLKKPAAPAPPPPGYLRVSSREEIAINLDGEDLWFGIGVRTFILEPDKSHSITVVQPSTFCRETREIATAPGDTITIDERIFSYGVLNVAATRNFSVELDGVPLGTPGRIFRRERLGACDHDLRIKCPGLVVALAEDFQNGIKLVPVEEAPGEALFRITITRDRPLEIFLDLVKNQ